MHILPSLIAPSPFDQCLCRQEAFEPDTHCMGSKFSTPNLSPAAHASDNIRSSSRACDLGRSHSWARSTQIWPRGEGALRVARVVVGTLFFRPISFLILHAPGKGEQQQKKHSSPRTMTKPSLGTSHAVFYYTADRI